MNNLNYAESQTTASCGISFLWGAYSRPPRTPGRGATVWPYGIVRVDPLILRFGRSFIGAMDPS
jgi:hypothetical protein